MEVAGCGGSTSSTTGSEINLPFRENETAAKLRQAYELFLEESATAATADSDDDESEVIATLTNHVACSSTLLIHGLDSSSQTWKSVLEALDTEDMPAVAIDCRGCGSHKTIGDPEQFTRDSLIDEIKAFVNRHFALSSSLSAGKKIVLVGHSMGGRMAVWYASKYPEDVASLVIEDMDVVGRRAMNTSPMSPGLALDDAMKFDAQRQFGFESEESLRQAFEDVQYSKDAVARWFSQGRIYDVCDKYWCDVNPAYRVLCYREFLDTDAFDEAWRQVCDQVGRHAKFPCLLMVAGPDGTVCKEPNIQRAAELMNTAASASGPLKSDDPDQPKPSATYTVKRYPNAAHSIHSTATEEYMADLKRAIEQASANK